MEQVEKAFAYITRGHELLVFEHVDAPEAGVQVPAGTIASSETATEAVLREAREETGLHDFAPPVHLGTVDFAYPASMRTIARRHFFH